MGILRLIKSMDWLIGLLTLTTKTMDSLYQVTFVFAIIAITLGALTLITCF